MGEGGWFFLQLLVQLLQVAGRILTQQDEVHLDALELPEGMREQQLADEGNILGDMDAHQQDG